MSEVKCTLSGCLVDHNITIIDEHNIWDIFEKYDESQKIRACYRWKSLYSDDKTDFGRAVVKKCKKFLKDLKTKKIK